MARMAWHPVEDDPLSINGPWPSIDVRDAARSIRRYAVPILRATSARLVPLATGTLVAAAERLYLVTAAHAFDGGVRVGDLAIGLAPGRVVRLNRVNATLVCDAEDDVAVLRLESPWVRRVLTAHWSALVLRVLAPAEGEHAVVCGYPVERSRWVDGVLHAKPVTVYTRRIDRDARGPRLAFGRVARRADATDVYTPALEGVSGATAWALAADGAGAALLRPAGVQVSYRHGDYIRCTDWQAVARLLERLDKPVGVAMASRIAGTMPALRSDPPRTTESA